MSKSRNVTAAERGATLAKEALAVRVVPPIRIADLERGNRAQRRAAAKQRRREGAGK